MLHVKLSSITFSSQLLDLFSYQNNNKSIKSNLVAFVYSPLFNSKIFIFVGFRKIKSIPSISELFSNSNWLEREASELSNVFFLNKKDTRNLLLPYGDNSSPFNKSFPSIGFRELYYDSISDSITSYKVSIQF